MTTITDKLKQQRQDLLSKDTQAVQNASNSLSFTNPRIEKLTADLAQIKADQQPKAEQLVEVVPEKTEDITDYRKQLLQEQAANKEQSTYNEEPVTETKEKDNTVTIDGQTYDNQPFSDILERADLTALQLQKAQKAAEEAALSSNTTLDQIASSQLAQTNGKTPIGDTSASFSSEYPEGYKFTAGNSGLGGQCAWYAEQITTLPDGSNWTIGSTIQEKKKQLAEHINEGNAFALGDDVPQVGNSIVFNGGKFGHVAVISKINPDGTAVLDESNYNNDKSVTKSRTVSLSDPTILGFLKTVPRK